MLGMVDHHYGRLYVDERAEALRRGLREARKPDRPQQPKGTPARIATDERGLRVVRGTL